MTTDKMIYSFVALCPECKEVRSLQFKRRMLEEELSKKTDIRVASPVCGHSWILTAEVTRNMRKRLGLKKL
jgi:hypothetical protein